MQIDTASNSESILHVNRSHDHQKCTVSGVSKKIQIGQSAISQRVTSHQPAGNQRATSQQPAGNQRAPSGQPAGNQPTTSGKPVENQRSTNSEVPRIFFTVFTSLKFKNHEDYRVIGKTEMKI